MADNQLAIETGQARARSIVLAHYAIEARRQRREQAAQEAEAHAAIGGDPHDMRRN